MKECKNCMQLSIDLMYYISRGSVDMALETVTKLKEVIETYKRSC